jgi:hypothetical protein
VQQAIQSQSLRKKSLNSIRESKWFAKVFRTVLFQEERVHALVWKEVVSACASYAPSSSGRPELELPEKYGKRHPKVYTYIIGFLLNGHRYIDITYLAY